MGETRGVLRVSTFGKPLAVLAAEDQGYFAVRALDVEYRQTRSSAEQIRELLSNGVDVAHTAVDNVIAYADAGEDLTTILVLELGIGQKLVVGQDVRSYADLTGCALGVDARTTGYAFVLREMLARNGIPDGSYGLVEVGGSAERARALAAGAIAGTLLAPPHDWPVKEAGCLVLDRAAAYFPDYPSVTAATTKRTARSCGKALAKYVQALVAGRDWAIDPLNRDSAIALIARLRNVRQSVAEDQYLEETGYRPVTSEDDVRRSIDVVRDLRFRMTRGTGAGAAIGDYFDVSSMRAGGAFRVGTDSRQ
jgi:ABC-type nitrate/sulfonate/bicarbonate transport system substrate-binding protein